MTNGPVVESLSPLKTLNLDTGLSLSPRLRLRLTVHRADLSLSPLDDWQLKDSLASFLSSSSSACHVITSPPDLRVRRFKNLKKRGRDEPVAVGSLFLRDLAAPLEKVLKRRGDDMAEEFKEWKGKVVREMDGIEVSLEGVKFRLSVEVPPGDDYETMKKEWEEYYAFGNGGYSRGGKQQPDTIVLRGVPSRWFAEPRVSSKPSMLVTHTILSGFGKIRNLSVAEDDDFNKDANEDDEIVSGLHCKIVVQYEKHSDFCVALKSLCGRSLQKEGSRLIADYEVTWNKDGSFRNAKSEASERRFRMPASGGGSYRSEARRHFSRYSPENERAKRFRD